ncbi:MAG: hypothetical protein H6740_01895 [Alphaproteobacteria bacterium]|nr:hypothetical protein [Alphaproteobacteria bacterium]
MALRWGVRPALGFLTGSNSGRPGATRREPREVPMPDGEVLPGDRYTPLGPCARGAVLFVHGMTWRGERDPRIVSACEALAATGRAVWAPRFPDILDMRIRQATVQRIAAACAHIAAEEGQPIGVASVSFSAGMALIAAGQPEARDQVASVLAIGGFTEADRAIRFLLTSPDADPYGRLVVLRDRLPLVREVSPALRAALLAAIQDEGFDPGEPRLPAARAALSDSDRALLDLLLGPHAPRAGLVDEMITAMGPEMRDFTVTPELARAIRARVCLAHGRSDRVIPPEESIALHALLRAEGKDSRLVVTPLIGHGTVGFDPAAILSVPRLFDTMRAFFSALDR